MLCFLDDRCRPGKALSMTVDAVGGKARKAHTLGAFFL